MRLDALRSGTDAQRRDSGSADTTGENFKVLGQYPAGFIRDGVILSLARATPPKNADEKSGRGWLCDSDGVISGLKSTK